MYVWQENKPFPVLEIALADSFWKRLVGLLGHTNLGARQGLFIPHCNHVHTLGMRFAIDLIFLDDNLRIVSLHTDVKHGRRLRDARAKHVLECASGTADTHQFHTHQTLEIRQCLNTFFY